MDKLNEITKQLAAIWKRISFNQRVSIVLVAVAAFVGLWIFAKTSHRPSHALLYPQALDATDAALIADKLRDENVAFQVRGGGRIYVPAQRVDELRLTMASAGLPANTGGTGWGDIFDKGGLGGKSETELDIGKLRALQGELARTISSLASVQSARVHLVMPEYRIFTKDQKPAKASVLLTLRPGCDLGSAEVNGICYLCASAIEGLKTGNITILDGNGQILARPRGEETMLDIGSEQFALARSVEKELTEKIASGLDPALGPGNWTATVTVELEAQSLETEETTSKSSVVVEEESSEHKSESTKSTPGGQPGVAENVDVGAVAAGSGGGSTDTEKTMRTKSVPNMMVRKVVVPPGSIKTVSASVIINKDREPTSENGTTLSVTAVEDFVKGVISYDSARNDQVSVQEASFVKAAATDAAAVSMPSPIITGIAKHGPAAIVSIALLGFLWVFMKKTKYADHGSELGTAMATAGAGGAGGAGGGHRKVVLPDGSASDKRVQEIFDDIVLEDAEAELRGLRDAMSKLAEERPESVAAVIRDWIS